MKRKGRFVPKRGIVVPKRGIVAVEERTGVEPTHPPSESVSQIPCSVCHQEIPLSAAVWREGAEHVAYFCGLECYERWRNQSTDPSARGDARL